MFDDLNAYFHENVWASYQNFFKAKKSTEAGKSRDLRLAINAALALYHLREHIPQHLQKSRATLAKLCPDYDLLGDVVNAAKHNVLTRGKPKVDCAEDIFEQVTSTLYKDEQGEYWHGEKSVFVKLTDGSVRDLFEVLTNVLNMWLSELHDLGVIGHVEPIEINDEGIPPRSSRSGAAPLNLEIIQGVRFIHNMRLQKYNYETGKVEPMDLSGAEAKFRVYKPLFDLNIALKNEKTGEEIIKIISLTEDQSQRILRLNTDEERTAFVIEVAKAHGILSQERDETDFSSES